MHSSEADLWSCRSYPDPVQLPLQQRNGCVVIGRVEHQDTLVRPDNNPAAEFASLVRIMRGMNIILCEFFLANDLY